MFRGAGRSEPERQAPAAQQPANPYSPVPSGAMPSGPALSGPVHPGNIEPLSTDRIARIFDSQGWDWGYDEDGDISTSFDGVIFVFSATGEQHTKFHVSTVKWPHVPSAQREQLLTAIEDWHRTYMWPQGLFVEGDPRGLAVCAEYTANLAAGVTDEQLLELCKVAIMSSIDFFEAIFTSLGMPAAQ